MTDAILEQKEQKIYAELEKRFENPTYIFEKINDKPTTEDRLKRFFHIKRVEAKNYSFFYILRYLREAQYECSIYLCKNNNIAFHGTGFFRENGNNLILESYGGDFYILNNFYEKVLDNIETKRPLPPPSNNLDEMLSFIKED